MIRKNKESNPDFAPRRSGVVPVFCDHCPSLALAELDGEVLCTTCLIQEIAADTTSDLVLKIRPVAVVDRSPAFFN